jgi:hypothetical protein
VAGVRAVRSRHPAQTASPAARASWSLLLRRVSQVVTEKSTPAAAGGPRNCSASSWRSMSVRPGRWMTRYPSNWRRFAGPPSPGTFPNGTRRPWTWPRLSGVGSSSSRVCRRGTVSRQRRARANRPGLPASACSRLAPQGAGAEIEVHPHCRGAALHGRVRQERRTANAEIDEVGRPLPPGRQVGAGHEQPQGWVNADHIFLELSNHGIPGEKSAHLLTQLTRTKILEWCNRDGVAHYRVTIPMLAKRLFRQHPGLSRLR